MTMDPLPGNPTALASRADDLSQSALAIQDAAEALFALGFAGTSEAISVIAEKADELADKLKNVHTRYSGTASALATFAVDLQSAHALANDAISDENSNGRAALNASNEINDLRDERRRVEDDDPASPKLEKIDDEMRDWANARDRYERYQYDATQQYARAQTALNTAAEQAISKIDTALSSTNDGFWDHVGDFFANIGDVLASIGTWIVEVLKTIVDVILITLGAIVVLLLAVLLLASILTTMFMLLPILLLIGGVLLVTLLVPGLESWRTQVLALLVGVAIPFVGVWLLWRVGSDIFAPDPTVTILDRKDIESAESRTAYDKANGTDGLYSLEDYVAAEGLTDTMGKEDRGVVDIRKVVGPDGEERWVVTLPSTQDWSAGVNGDSSATNDLDSNLALMLTPEQQTQYERAVLKAMEMAGIGPNDPVMLVGFSQGGIMAGHLAANRSNAYNFEAVLVYGAPIDAMNIPESTRVLSIQHTGDPVPMLDLTDPKPNTPNHTTVQLDAQDGTIGMGAHNNDKYYETAAYSDGLAPYQDYFEEFSGTVTEQNQFTWQE